LPKHTFTGIRRIASFNPNSQIMDPLVDPCVVEDDRNIAIEDNDVITVLVFFAHDRNNEARRLPSKLLVLSSNPQDLNDEVMVRGSCARTRTMAKPPPGKDEFWLNKSMQESRALTLSRNREATTQIISACQPSGHSLMHEVQNRVPLVLSSHSSWKHRFKRESEDIQSSSKTSLTRPFL
jgi:hypothetical protein